MEFRILGPLEVLDGERVIAFEAAKQRALLAVLLLHANGVVPRERLIDELWGERPPATAAKVVQAYVSQLRRRLGRDAIATRGPGYLLRVDEDAVDATRFRRLVAEGRRLATSAEQEPAAHAYRAALALWRGPALADVVVESFARNEIERLEEERLGALGDRIDCELALGRHEDVIPELETLVREHPLRERLRAQLMLALYRSGRQADALAAYQQARRTLAEELGLEPGGELQELERAILNHDPALRIRELASANLPAPPTPLVGRRGELAEVSALLARSETRLVTLTGPGGSGKTRLALEVAAELEGKLNAPAFFVELAPLTQPELVLSAIARTVGLENAGPGSTCEAIREFLRHRCLLLVLDNFEHLLDAGPDVAALLRSVPGLTVLATSRSPLRLRGEWRYEVRPLPIDDAVALFVERARAAESRFEPDSAVEELCRRLDGLPLAIELAAARINVLTPTQILGRLARRLDLLAAGARDAPERQRGLRATIDWSYKLLNDEEQRLFERLSVFAGGCTLDGAEQVCEAEPDTLASLVDKSLLRHGEGRYWMLDTIRAYASERLSERRLADVTTRALAEYLLALVQEGAGQLRATPPPEAVRDRLGAELDNLRVAVAWALAAEEAELALQLSIEARWSAPPVRLEQRRWLDEGLRAAHRVSPTTRAEALHTAGAVAWTLGDVENAQALLEQSLAVCDELTDKRGSMWNLHLLGVIASVVFGDHLRGRNLLEQSLKLATRISDRRGIYRALHDLGEVESALGHLDRASELLGRSAELARDADDASVLCQILHGAGDVALAERDLSGAIQLYRDALRLSDQLSDRRLATYCLAGLAAAAAVTGNVKRAGQLWGALETLEQDAECRLADLQRRKYEEPVEASANSAPIAFATARDHGRSLSSDDTIAYALEHLVESADAEAPIREARRI
jgi:predicted ATPase/DNA-binding SARP family transcriptional activator